jgi:ketosteroid isomerase-like protein
MADDNVGVVRGAYDAFQRGDVPAIIGILHDDIEWHVPAVLPHGFDARGHEQVGQFFARLVERWDELGIEIGDFVASGAHVVAPSAARAARSMDRGPATASRTCG